MADYTSVVQDLANVTWRRLSKDDMPGVNAREIARVFPRDSDADGDNIITFLDTYVDLANHTAGTPLPYVDDPVMENVTYPGRWRLVSNSYNARAGGYVQVLRLGWVTTTPEADAVYVNVERSNQSGKLTLVRKWQFIDPASVELLMKSQNANPKVLANVVTDPMADGKTYEGEWLAITTQGPKSEYGECTIIQTLIKAGDANLTVILGTNKTTSSRECYKWQTTEADIEAFRTHTGVYAAEFDYKWGTAEVGIQKDWQPSQAADSSLNLVARYIVKEPWFYPANGTDFVVVNNLNGIYTESTRKFKNTTLPVANAGELVKALEDELGQFSGEVIKRTVALTEGEPTAFVMAASSIYEWDIDRDTARIPIMSASTDPDNHPPRVLGYNVWKIVCPFRRKVVVTITRQYYAAMPSVTPTDSGTFISDNASYVHGGGKAVIKNVIEISEGLYAIETKTFITEDWTQKPTIPIPLYAYTAPPS